VLSVTRIGRNATVALAGAATLGALLAGYSWRIEPRRLRRTILRVTLPTLTPQLAGARLAFLTDFHLGGPGPSERLTREAIRAARDWRTELVLLGGDYFDQGIFRPTTAFDDLRELPAVYGVLGNHDYRQSEAAAERIVRFLEERGVVMLRNQAVDLDLRGGTIRLIGLDDPYTGRATLHPWLRHSPSATVPTLALAHAPLIVDRLPSGIANLMLSGHTHGGQICLSPWSRLTPLDAAWYLDLSRGRTPSRQQRGFHWERGTLLYVSSGIGMTTLPLRFLAPPEVVLIELAAEPADPTRPCDHPMRYVRRLAYLIER